MSTPKISIIIPVYNVEPYLDRCLNSVLSQSFTDFEVLLIDDGSTDASGKICDKYASRDERIRVFHKENGGVSSARNVGLKEAKGEWIYFVDADDEVLPDGLQALVDGIRDDVDVVMGNWEKRDNEDNLLWKIDSKACLLTKKDGILINFGLSNKCPGNWGWLFMKLFKTSVIRNKNLLFTPEITYNEDELFIIQYLCACKGVTNKIIDSVYCYRESATSVMESTKYRFNPRILESFDAQVRMCQCIANDKESDAELVRVAKDGIINRYLMIRGQMEQHNAIDKKVLKDFRHRCIQECGFWFVVGYMIRRTSRRTKNFIKRKIKI